MIIKKQEGKIVIEPRLFVSRAKEDVLANASLAYAIVGGNAGANIGGAVAGVDGNVKLNAGGFGAIVGGNAGANIGGAVAITEGNAGANICGALAGVGGNSGANICGLFAVVGGNAGANIGGAVAITVGNAKLNASLGYSEVGKSHDYTIGDICSRITKYLPDFIRKINLPALNFGVITNTKNPYNSFILGVFNNIKYTENDYFALGVVNRITDENGKTRYSLPLSGRFHFDGVFSHRNNKSLDAKVEEQK